MSAIKITGVDAACSCGRKVPVFRDGSPPPTRVVRCPCGLVVFEASR